MDIETELDAFRVSAAILRFSWPEDATPKQLGRLFKMFAEQASKHVQNAPSSDFKTFRLSVVAALLNRPVTSFSAITKGEAMLLINEAHLDDLVKHVWERQQHG